MKKSMNINTKENYKKIYKKKLSPHTYIETKI